MKDWVRSLNPSPYKSEGRERPTIGFPRTEPRIVVKTEDINRAKKIAASEKGIQILGRM